MSFATQKIVIEALRTMLRPLMRFCVRYSVQIQDVIESVKVVLIEVAREDMEKRQEEPNVSRLAAMTGMHRREVTRIFREDVSEEEPQGLIIRVIGQWMQDKRFRGKSGRPRPLRFDGQDCDFRELVRSVSQDMNPGTILLELERLGAVKRRRGYVTLTTRAYVPRGDLKAGLKMLAGDVDDLVTTVEGNIFAPRDIPNLHAKTEYDNIAAAALPAIREWLYKEGSAFHQKARNYLARFDRDVSPEAPPGPAGSRVVLGSFGFALAAEEKP